LRRPTLRRLPRRVVAPSLAVALVAALLLVGVAAGRAEPSGNYRPPLSPDALSTGCYPLPDGLVLDLPHQVRHDGDVGTAAGPRRQLVLQWDLLDAGELVEALDDSLEAAGYTRTGELVWERGAHRVAATVTELPDLPEDSIVRGRLVLDLPVAPLSSTDPACADPYSTKRFPTDTDGLRDPSWESP
jgi:hypothetical protein